MIDKTFSLSIKTLLFLSIVSVIPMLGNAQTSDMDIKPIASYRYDYTAFMDKNGNIEGELDISGAIILAEVDGTEFIHITIGEEFHTQYAGFVKTKKHITEGDSVKVTVYLLGSEIEDHKIPIQLFEIYDLTKSSHIPDLFIVTIHSATTGEIEKSQIMRKISRVR